ncbi:MAG: hypothetical protein WCP21_19400 [Armatimonadota bacterium]
MIEKILDQVEAEIADNKQKTDIFRKLRTQFATEIQEFELVSGRLPDPKFKIKAIWVLSGSGSYLKPLLEVERDRLFEGTDRMRLDYAKECINSSLEKPALIYNGTSEQIKDLESALQTGEYKLSIDQVKIIGGEIHRTLDQVKQFSYPADVSVSEGDYLGVLSHAAHLPRVLRMMNAHKEKFKAVKILPLSLKLQIPSDEDEFIKRELLGIIDYILKNEATIEPYGTHD